MSVWKVFAVAGTFLSSCLALATSPQKRAIVFISTCSQFEQGLRNDLADFSAEGIPQLDLLKKRGWIVQAFYGGKSVRCDPSNDPTCLPAPKEARLEEVLRTSSLRADEVGEATTQNLVSAISDAVSNAPSQLFVSIVTHGLPGGFCASDRIMAYDELTKPLQALKDTETQIGISVSACYSGSLLPANSFAWQASLGPKACAVSTASATMEGMKATFEHRVDVNATTAWMAQSDKPATLEDLYLARLFSPAALMRFNQGEMSGFSNGKKDNDRLSGPLATATTMETIENFKVWIEQELAFANSSVRMKEWTAYLPSPPMPAPPTVSQRFQQDFDRMLKGEVELGALASYFAIAMGSKYLNYKVYLESSAELSEDEKMDRTTLKACSDFAL